MYAQMQLARTLSACRPSWHAIPAQRVAILQLSKLILFLITSRHDGAVLQDVAYSIPGKAGAKHTIIQGITGYFEPGQMTAVVCPARVAAANKYACSSSIACGPLQFMHCTSQGCSEADLLLCQESVDMHAARGLLQHNVLVCCYTCIKRIALN
jgi:hypothetical protein